MKLIYSNNINFLFINSIINSEILLRRNQLVVVWFGLFSISNSGLVYFLVISYTVMSEMHKTEEQSVSLSTENQWNTIWPLVKSCHLF